MVRVFIAIELPSPVKERIAETQRELMKCDAKLSPVNPSIAHLTLKFIGEVDEQALSEIKANLEALSYQPFEMVISGVSTNNPRRPRVIWTLARDQGECAALHRRIEDLLVPLGVKREHREFTPHITIARVKRFHPSLLAGVEAASDDEFGSAAVKGCVLKKSTLTPKGPIYEDLLEVVF
jgi:2'-5' RNA ligase